MKNLEKHSSTSYCPSRQWQNNSCRKQKESFSGFMQKIIRQFNSCGKQRSAETYQSALSSFVQFHKKPSLKTKEIDSRLMNAYEAYLHTVRGITRNSSSFYMRILRAAYNRAVEQGRTPDHNPFKNVYTGIDKTPKRAIPLKTIRKIQEIDLTQHPDYDTARNLFLFSLYTRGMSFVDIIHLKKQNLSHEVLSYKRRKTGQTLHIKWERCMENVAAKLGHGKGEYMFPILDPKKGDTRTQYKRYMCITNYRLRRIGEMIGMHVPLTMYVARHSWASIAHSKNIPVSVISEGMGHENEKTTRVYLASLDQGVVDRANSLIINALTKKKH